MASQNYYVHLNLNQNEVQNAVVQNLATAPSSPVEGQIYYNNTGGDKKPYFYDGTTWRSISGAVESVNGQTGVVVLDHDDVGADEAGSAAAAQAFAIQRTNHTGTQTASTISDFDTQVRTSRLDQMANPTNNISLNGNKITNLAEGTVSTDAATIGQLTAGVSGSTWKDPVRVATTANITLSGTQTIDGISVVEDDRVLVKNQSTASQNGIYVVASGAWSRSADMNAPDNFTNATVLVRVGTVNQGDIFKQTETVATVGTDTVTWVQIAEGNTVYTADGSTIILTGTEFSVGTVPFSSTSGTVPVNRGGTNITSYTANNYIRASGATTLEQRTPAQVLSDIGAASSSHNHDSTYLQLTGGTLTGPLTLSGAPTNSLHAATKAYVDSHPGAVTSVFGRTGIVVAQTNDYTWAQINKTTSSLADITTRNISDTTGTLAVNRGGTGATTFTSNGVLLGAGTGAVVATAAGTANQVLRIPGAGGAPAFGSIALNQAAAVTGTLGAGNGGTGIASYTTGNYIRASGATALEQRTPAQVLSDIGAAEASHNHNGVHSRIHTASIGNGSLTTIGVTHNFGTRDVTVQVYRVASPYDTIVASVERTTTNAVNISFNSAPASNEYRVVVMG